MAAPTEKQCSSFSSMPNFRHIESPFEDGGLMSKETRPKLFRSSRPDFLTDQEIRTFKELDIQLIIDFRSPREYRLADGGKLLDPYYPVYAVKIPPKYHACDSVVMKPMKTQSPNLSYMNGAGNYPRPLGKHCLINFFKINYIWAVFNRAPWYIKIYSLVYIIYDLIMGTGYKHFVRFFAKRVLNKTGLFGQYMDMLTYSKASICSALKLLCEPGNIPAMLNCAHGKDRTGLVSALLLCLGMSKEDIALDYAKSEPGLEPMKDRLRREIVDRFHMCQSFLEAKASTMLQVLNYIDDNYGSLTAYLEDIGFGMEEQEKLRQNLTGSGKT